MNRLELGLAIARGDVSPDRGADLAKSLPPTHVRVASDDLRKGGGSWVDIPGDEHGGEQKLHQDSWIRRWPSAEKAKQAATRYEKLAASAMLARDAAEAANTAGVPMPYNGAEWRYRDLARYASQCAELLTKSLVKSGAGLADADLVKAAKAVDGDENSDTPPEGKHFVAEPGDGAKKKLVHTVAEHGHFAVHGGAAPSVHQRGNADTAYTVTHKPSGLAVGQSRTKAGAVAQAKHFHKHAGDAGKDAKFGETPTGEDIKRLGAAKAKWAEKTAQKSMQDWQPFSGAPEGASARLSKGFSDHASGDHMGLPENAFHGLKGPALRKGGGDSKLQGVGAGFDSRWNDGQGFGRQE